MFVAIEGRAERRTGLHTHSVVSPPVLSTVTHMHFGTAQWAAKRPTTDHAVRQVGRARLQRHVCALCLPRSLPHALPHSLRRTLAMGECGACCVVS